MALHRGTFTSTSLTGDWRFTSHDLGTEMRKWDHGVCGEHGGVSQAFDDNDADTTRPLLELIVWYSPFDHWLCFNIQLNDMIIISFLQQSSNCCATRASMKLESHHSYYSLWENCNIGHALRKIDYILVRLKSNPAVKGLHRKLCSCQPTKRAIITRNGHLYRGYLSVHCCIATGVLLSCRRQSMSFRTGGRRDTTTVYKLSVSLIHWYKLKLNIYIAQLIPQLKALGASPDVFHPGDLLV